MINKKAENTRKNGYGNGNRNAGQGIRERANWKAGQKIGQDTASHLDTSVHDIAKVDFALQDAMEEAGMEAKTYGIWGFFWRITRSLREREKHAVRKKTYIWLVVLTGWLGGHRFYARRFYLGGLYLIFFWTLIPVMMSMLDLMEVIPMKADENGIIMM